MKTFIYYTNNKMSGRAFVLVDDIAKVAHIGNTAATALNYNSDVNIEVRNKKQLEKVANSLAINGYEVRGR